MLVLLSSFNPQRSVPYIFWLGLQTRNQARMNYTSNGQRHLFICLCWRFISISLRSFCTASRLAEISLFSKSTVWSGQQKSCGGHQRTHCFYWKFAGDAERHYTGTRHEFSLWHLWTLRLSSNSFVVRCRMLTKKCGEASCTCGGKGSGSEQYGQLAGKEKGLATNNGG